MPTINPKQPTPALPQQLVIQQRLVIQLRLARLCAMERMLAGRAGMVREGSLQLSVGSTGGEKNETRPAAPAPDLARSEPHR